jgi:hypothetical protein
MMSQCETIVNYYYNRPIFQLLHCLEKSYMTSLQFRCDAVLQNVHNGNSIYMSTYEPHDNEILGILLDSAYSLLILKESYFSGCRGINK